MGKKSFKFRRHDHVGAAGAEEDDDFLQKCFVDTGDLELLENPKDNRLIVLGRTGTGKTALLLEMARRQESSIGIQPDNLALSYISNSTILQFFTSLGVNLDPFFKLLWRHVLTVEILNHYFSNRGGNGKRNLIERLRSMFAGVSLKEKKAREAIDYLETWGKSFWMETEYRVKEITEKVESDLTEAYHGKIKTPTVDLGAGFGATDRLSREEKKELVASGQSIVNKAQVQDLSKVLDLLDAVLGDRQKRYYVLIDSLDEDWVEERLRYKLIMALIVTAREFIRVRQAKIIVALRRDLAERVFRLARDSGFQEEKYQSLYLPLEWSEERLIELLDRRISHLVSQRYTKEKVTHKDLLPRQIRKTKITTYITSRARRPRDVIALFNACIAAGLGKSRITADAFRKAEGEWSRSRLRALGDEWSGDYPRLLDFVKLLGKKPASFKLSTIEADQVEEICLDVAVSDPSGRGVLQQIALRRVDLLITTDEARIQIVRIFYRVGLVGLKLVPHEGESWVDELGRAVSMAEITPAVSVVVHPAFHRALGIR